MLFKDFERRLKDGNLSLDDVYWVVDYRFNYIHTRPTRNLKPTEVKVFDSRKHPSSKFEYGIWHYFRPLGANGGLLKKEISPVDSLYTREYLNVFLTEEEAWDFYETQAKYILTQIVEGREDNLQEFNEREQRFDAIQNGINEILNQPKP